MRVSAGLKPKEHSFHKGLYGWKNLFVNRGYDVCSAQVTASVCPQCNGDDQRYKYAQHQSELLISKPFLHGTRFCQWHAKRENPLSALVYRVVVNMLFNYEHVIYPDSYNNYRFNGQRLLL